MQGFAPIHCPLRGCVFIEASAGTGKTHSITSLVLRLVLEEHVGMDQFLLVTYTNAATDELRRKTRDRFNLALRQLGGSLGENEAPDLLLYEMLEEQRIDADTAMTNLRQALLNFDELAILTIHSFCQRVLRDRAFESGQMFDTELEPDEMGLIQDTVYDFWRKLVPQQRESFFSYLRQSRRGLGELIALARTAISRADAAILPGASMLSLDTYETSWRQLISETELLLANSKDEILEVFRTAELNARVYQPRRLALWLNHIAAWLEQPFPLITTCEHLQRFTNETLAESTTAGEEPPSHEFFDLCDALLEQGAQIEAVLERQWIQIKRDLLVYLRQKLPERKQSLNRFAYEDLLQNALKALQTDGGLLAQSLAAQYPVILIDEFQDTDPTQYAIFQHVHETEAHQLLCLIGDPKQAIYAFRGGDIFTYTHARSKADYLATLGENWRSSPGLIHAVNTVYAQAIRPFWTDAIDYHAVSPPPVSMEERQRTLLGDDASLASIQLWQISGANAFKAEQDCVEATCQEIARLVQLGRNGSLEVNGRPLLPSDIAILIRSHWQARGLQERLQELGVRTVSYDRQHIFKTKEADCFDIFLRVLATPRDESLLKALLLSDFMGLSSQDLQMALADEGRWGALLEMIASYRAQWKAEGFIVMFRRFLREEHLPQRLLALPNGERRLTNALHLSELTEEAQATMKLSIHATLQWFREQRDSVLSEEKELRLESDDDRIKILTIHRSKGLEFPFVFMPFAWVGPSENRKTPDHVAFHQSDEEGGYARFIDVGSTQFADHRHLAGEEEAAEELRMLYVAITRAQHRLYLIFAPEPKKYKTSSLAYLWHHRESDLEGNLTDVSQRLSLLSVSRFREDLNKLVGQSEGNIALLTWDGRQQTTLSPLNEERAQVARHFQAKPVTHWGITSYSAIAGHGETLELPDRDMADPLPAPPVPVDQLTGMDALPRGARTGNMLHALYENLPFDADLQAILEESANQLGIHGLSAEDWLDLIALHTLEFFESDLGGFRLADIAKEKRLNELAFHFPISTLTVARLEAFFIQNDLASHPHPFDFYPVEGFLKGFIDLVVEHEGRYYVLDYKSNFLGGHAADYHCDRLPGVMADSNYVLQYHLYTVALHRYLSYRLGAHYDYDKHFGGVRYLFIRGISQASSPEYGVFSDRPSKSLITELSSFLTEEPHG